MAVKSFAFIAKTTPVMRFIHIYSAVPVLLSMLFFAVTGFYLNHPELEPGTVQRAQRELHLPAPIAALDTWQSHYTENTLKLLQWLDREHGLRGVDFAVEFDELDNLVIIDLSGPNGHSLVEVALEEGLVRVDQRKLSFWATLNNLHRAKHVSGLWLYLSDLSALCMLAFCLSGFWLVAVNKIQRLRATWTMLLGSCLFVLVVALMH